MMDDRSFSAAQRFLLSSKNFWTTTLYARLREEYMAAAAAAQVTAQSIEDVAGVTEDLTTYRYFAWLERHLQRLKYSGRYGLTHYYEERRAELARELAAADDPILDLQPEIQLPAYYTRVDIHQHPGGVWSDDVAGFVYERGARSTTPLLGEGHGDLHTRFADVIAQTGTPRRILDLGCGFGKSTLPFATKFRCAQVEGVDLSEPCLRLAARMACGVGATNIRFRQRDAANTGYPDAAFDLVTSTMFLHETPVEPLGRIFSEIYRMLEPGGRMVHLDFYRFADAFARFMHYGHARRNNEPYMQPLAELDLPRMLQEKGFTQVRIEPFSEAPGIDPADTSAWRFPWTVISAVKPAQKK